MENPIDGYTWIIRDPEKFGGEAIVKGTRLTVSFLSKCLLEGMSFEEITQTYSDFPQESIPELLKFIDTL